MVIVLQANATIDDRYLSHPPKIVTKWPNDQDFGFDIAQPGNWFTFLMNLKLDGKPLPRQTKGGSPIAYRVYVWGAIMKDKGLTSHGSGNTLFPGYSVEGKKLFMAKQGTLTKKNAEFWASELKKAKK